jgi:hypothetical protein
MKCYYCEQAGQNSELTLLHSHRTVEGTAKWDEDGNMIVPTTWAEYRCSEGHRYAEESNNGFIENRVLRTDDEPLVEGFPTGPV